MSRLEQVLENSKSYLDLAEKRSMFYNNVEKALDIVKDFIQERKRIIYGGMSIDLALKAAKAKGIYADDAIPDYDFMSPDFYKDSIELADILHEAGLQEISSINALHVTTRRVRVNFIPVADITYIPQEIYDIIPTIEYEGFRVVHPDFQRLDMHRAFGYPFTDPPREPILHRFQKDQRRFTLLTERYPIDPPLDLDARLSKETKTIEVKVSDIQNTCLGGIVVYGLLRNLINRKKDLLGDGAALDKLYPADTEIREDRIIVTLPAGAPYLFNISTDHFSKLVKNLEKKTKQKPAYYDRYLDDLRPRTILVGEFEIFDNKGKLLPCFNLQKIVRHWLGLKGDKLSNLYIVQSPQVLLYFLQRSYDSEFQHVDDLWIYWSLTKIIELAAIAWTAEDKDYHLWPFFLSVYTYGEHNWSPAYILSIGEKWRRIHGLPEATGLRPVFGYYPDKGAPADFTPSSELFRIDGRRRDGPFEELSIMQK